ncbi:MAG: hypothetical protein M3P01_12685 [Actinomycetota bacterium]|nr:hypothetical protein [Actinomycetota bacterium]
MRRFALLVTGALLLGLTGLVTAPPALANNDPHRVFLPAGPVDLPVGFCSFPTHLDVVANKEYGKITTLPDGTTIIEETGTFKLRATNVTTGKTVLLNASGPGTITIYPDGSVTVDGTGHWLIFNLSAAAASFGFPGVMLTSGQIHETLDPTGTPTALSVTGRATDVCAALG